MTIGIILITFLISLSSLLFKTTKDIDGSNRKALTPTGGFIFVLMLILLGVNFWNEHLKKMSALKDMQLAVEKVRADSLRWELQKNSFKFSIAKARQDSVNFRNTVNNLSQIKSLNNLALNLSRSYNEELKVRIAKQSLDVERQLYPLDSISIDMNIEVMNSGIAKGYYSRVGKLIDQNPSVLPLPDPAIAEERELYQIFSNFYVFVAIFGGLEDRNYSNEFLKKYYTAQKDFGADLNFRGDYSILTKDNRKVINFDFHHKLLKIGVDGDRITLFLQTTKFTPSNDHRLNFKNLKGYHAQVTFPETNQAIFRTAYIGLRSKTGYLLEATNLFKLHIPVSTNQDIIRFDKEFSQALY